jgi:acetate kinase
MADRILTVNVGSSSVKTAVFEPGAEVTRLASAEVSGVGSERAELSVRLPGSASTGRGVEAPDHAAGVRLALAALRPSTDRVIAVMHRIVHGGDATRPQWIDRALLSDLDRLRAFATEHLPPALDAITITGGSFRGARQAACFDTAFHATLPGVARMYPLPRRFADAGVRRYGFHGLSCESVMDSLRAVSPRAASGRIVIAHLGSGASLTAVRDGRSVETTMGFSPAGGVMMSTRSGDVDPGVLVFAVEHERLDAAGLGRLVTREAGLIGVSGSSRDMRDLLRPDAGDRAREAVALFCYTARKALGALAAVLGGLDTIVFTGGIGEHAAEVRQDILAGLDDFGIRIDPSRNPSHDAVVSPDDARVTVRVVRSDEDRMLARHASALLQEDRS